VATSLRLIGTPGQSNGAFATELVDGFGADATIGDKGYDADHLRDKIAERQKGQPKVVIRPSGISAPTTPSATPLVALLQVQIVPSRRVMTNACHFIDFVRLAAIATSGSNS
jgi:putative transposase